MALSTVEVASQPVHPEKLFHENGNNQLEQGGIVRTDTSQKRLTLVFTAHEYADGHRAITKALDKHQVKAAFFFTGGFYRAPENASIIKGLQEAGHYLGGHSDKHLLYAPLENRNSLLVDEQTFKKDLLDNYREMERFSIEKAQARYFLPPYEWYNQTISTWALEEGVQLVNFTPGTYSNADYTHPDLGAQYRDNAFIYRKILEFEQENGLNGFLLLTHFGTDPRRKEKFYDCLDRLITELIGRGYSLVPLEEAVGG